MWMLLGELRGHPEWAILSQAAKAEGATTIPDRGVDPSGSKRPALQYAGDDMVWSAWQHAAVARRCGTSDPVRTKRSDFGTLSIVPNRFQPAHYAYVLDPSTIRERVLRPFFIKQMAATGDSDKRLLIKESGLQVDNEAANGIAADLTSA